MVQTLTDTNIFQLSTLKDTAKAPAVDISRSNTLRDTKSTFYFLKGATNTPVSFISELPHPSELDKPKQGNIRPKIILWRKLVIVSVIIKERGETQI